MDRALYTSMTGAKHNTLAQTVHANNLANVSTDGFRRDYVAARSMGVWYGDGLPTRVHALTERPATDLPQHGEAPAGRLQRRLRHRGQLLPLAPRPHGPADPAVSHQLIPTRRLP